MDTVTDGVVVVVVEDGVAGCVVKPLLVVVVASLAVATVDEGVGRRQTISLPHKSSDISAGSMRGRARGS